MVKYLVAILLFICSFAHADTQYQPQGASMVFSTDWINPVNTALPLGVPSVVGTFIGATGGSPDGVADKITVSYNAQAPNILFPNGSLASSFNYHAYNLERYSEDMTWAYHSAGPSLTTTTTTTNYNGIVLTLVTGNSFYSEFKSQWDSGGYYPLVSTNYYIISSYQKSDVGRFAWTRGVSTGSSDGYGARYVSTGGNRIWAIASANNTDRFTLTYRPRYFFNCYGGSVGNVTTVNFYIGGLQVTQISAALAAEASRQSTVVVGDSTMAGSSGGLDFATSVEVSRWSEGLLNNDWYNRAVGGTRTDHMIASWNQLISPLSYKCKYAVIQGGINDISQSIATATIQANLTTLYNMAISENMIPVMFTISPFGCATASENKRVAINSWIISTFPKTCDIATILTSPTESNKLDPRWINDGVHYSALGKETAGRYIATQNFWDLISPTQYTKTVTEAVNSVDTVIGSNSLGVFGAGNMTHFWQYPDLVPTATIARWQVAPLESLGYQNSILWYWHPTQNNYQNYQTKQFAINSGVSSTTTSANPVANWALGGGGMLFSSANSQYITVPTTNNSYFNSSSNFTIIVTYKRSGLNTVGYLIGNRDAEAAGFILLRASDTQVRFSIKSGVESFYDATITEPFSLNTVALTYDGTLKTMYIYVNGIIKNTTKNAGFFGIFTRTTWGIGSISTAVSAHNGTIYHAAIYPYNMTPQQIYAESQRLKDRYGRPETVATSLFEQLFDSLGVALSDSLGSTLFAPT